jgi:HEAT repeat protein
MLAASDARVHWLERRLVWLVLITLAVATTSGCGKIEDKSTEELIAIVQQGEYNAVKGSGPACGAAYNLGLRKATEAVDALVGGLSTPAVDCMALALGQIGDPRAVEPLLEALRTGLPGFASDYRLTQLFLFEEDKAEYESADEALIAIGALAVDPLLTIAGSGDELTRNLVTYVLGRIRDPRAEAYLIDGLKAGATTSLLAADALARIFGDEIDRLLPLLQSKETVTIAYGLVGLGHSGTEGALGDALMQSGDLGLAEFYLNSGNHALRTAALEWASANGYQLALPSGVPGGTVAPPGWGDLGADLN